MLSEDHNVVTSFCRFIKIHWEIVILINELRNVRILSQLEQPHRNKVHQCDFISIVLETTIESHILKYVKIYMTPCQLCC